jgi:SAM-dependent methyltransferase
VTTSTPPVNEPAICKSEWESSYAKRDNFLFYPHEEVIRFVSKYIRKRIGLNEFIDAQPAMGARTILDLGCGIGRHVIYSHDMGLQAYGVDLSERAVGVAREWADTKGAAELASRILQGDVRKLPWSDGFFHYAVSHGVLDSMPYEVARAACVELKRVMAPQGLFYCDLVSGDDSKHAREFSGAERVTTTHEQGTVQQYFNQATLHTLFAGLFEIRECNLIRREEVLKGGHTSRYHVIVQRL